MSDSSQRVIVNCCQHRQTGQGKQSLGLSQLESIPLEAWTQLCPRARGQGRRRNLGDFNFLGDQREEENS